MCVILELETKGWRSLMEKRWTMSELGAGNERVVFAFDYRRLPIWKGVPRNEQGVFRPGDSVRGEGYPATLSETVWPTIICAPSNAERIGPEPISLELFKKIPEPPDNLACAVAFDVAKAAIPHLSAQGWFRASEVSELPSNIQWTLAGFDVADDWLQFSALYGFTWNEDIDALVNDPGVTFADCGVFANEESAIIACRYFECLAPEHAPFVPCGVWLGRPK